MPSPWSPPTRGQIQPRLQESQTKTHVDWEAFSSNQRACRMAARALWSTLISTGRREKERGSVEEAHQGHISACSAQCRLKAAFHWSCPIPFPFCQDSDCKPLRAGTFPLPLYKASCAAT